MGCGIAGAVAGAGTIVEGVKTANEATAKLDTASKLIKGGSTVGEGVTHFGSAFESREAAAAFARSEVHSTNLRHLERTQDHIVKTLGETAKSYERALGTLVEIVSEQARCRETLARNLA